MEYDYDQEAWFPYFLPICYETIIFVRTFFYIGLVNLHKLKIPYAVNKRQTLNTLLVSFVAVFHLLLIKWKTKNTTLSEQFKIILEVHVHLYYSIYRVHPILVVLWKIVFRTPETKHFEENWLDIKTLWYALITTKKIFIVTPLLTLSKGSIFVLYRHHLIPV